MSVEIITKEDLQLFRLQLLNELRELIEHAPKKSDNKYLRSGDVKKLLGISTGTLQSLRISNKLHPVKIGGLYYYDSNEISKLLAGK